MVMNDHNNLLNFHKKLNAQTQRGFYGHYVVERESYTHKGQNTSSSQQLRFNLVHETYRNLITKERHRKRA